MDTEDDRGQPPAGFAARREIELSETIWFKYARYLIEADSFLLNEAEDLSFKGKQIVLVKQGYLKHLKKLGLPLVEPRWTSFQHRNALHSGTGLHKQRLPGIGEIEFCTITKATYHMRVPKRIPPEWQVLQQDIVQLRPRSEQQSVGANAQQVTAANGTQPAAIGRAGVAYGQSLQRDAMTEVWVDENDGTIQEIKHVEGLFVRLWLQRNFCSDEFGIGIWLPRACHTVLDFYLDSPTGDYLVDRAKFTRSVTRRWTPGDRFQMFWNDPDNPARGELYYGSIVKVLHREKTDPLFHCPWETIQVRWDDYDDIDNVNVWEIAPEQLENWGTTQRLDNAPGDDVWGWESSGDSSGASELSDFDDEVRESLRARRRRRRQSRRARAQSNSDNAEHVAHASTPPQIEPAATCTSTEQTQLAASSSHGGICSSNHSTPDDAIPATMITFKRRGKSDWNSYYCNHCWDGGELVACDGACLRSFHVQCLDASARPDPNEPDTAPWFCPDCRRGVARCAVCNVPGTAEKDVFKCKLNSCGKFYHWKCLLSLPMMFRIDSRAVGNLPREEDEQLRGQLLPMLLGSNAADAVKDFKVSSVPPSETSSCSPLELQCGAFKFCPADVPLEHSSHEHTSASPAAASDTAAAASAAPPSSDAHVSTAMVSRCSSGLLRLGKAAKRAQIICPAHFCHQCHSGDSSMRHCYQCLRAYHGGCLVEGSDKFNNRDILCMECKFELRQVARQALVEHAGSSAGALADVCQDARLRDALRDIAKEDKSSAATQAALLKARARRRAAALPSTTDENQQPSTSTAPRAAAPQWTPAQSSLAALMQQRANQLRRIAAAHLISRIAAVQHSKAIAQHSNAVAQHSNAAAQHSNAVPQHNNAVPQQSNAVVRAKPHSAAPDTTLQRTSSTASAPAGSHPTAAASAGHAKSLRRTPSLPTLSKQQTPAAAASSSAASGHDGFQFDFQPLGRQDRPKAAHNMPLKTIPAPQRLAVNPRLNAAPARKPFFTVQPRWPLALSQNLQHRPTKPHFFKLADRTKSGQLTGTTSQQAKLQRRTSDSLTNVSGASTAMPVTASSSSPFGVAPFAPSQAKQKAGHNLPVRSRTHDSADSLTSHLAQAASGKLSLEKRRSVDTSDASGSSQSNTQPVPQRADDAARLAKKPRMHPEQSQRNPKVPESRGEDAVATHAATLRKIKTSVPADAAPTKDTPSQAGSKPESDHAESSRAIDLTSDSQSPTAANSVLRHACILDMASGKRKDLRQKSVWLFGSSTTCDFVVSAAGVDTHSRLVVGATAPALQAGAPAVLVFSHPQTSTIPPSINGIIIRHSPIIPLHYGTMFTIANVSFMFEGVES